MAFIQLKLYSASLKTRTNVNVIVPTLLPAMDGSMRKDQEFSEFYKSHGQFPVLYLLHGTFGDEGDWQRFSRIEDYARKCNLMVVMPFGENSCFRDEASGKNYETYITQELPEIIRWMFPASGRREDTFICGLSMGGGAAVRLGLAHPDIYGYAAGLSSELGSVSQMVMDNSFTIWSHAFDGIPMGKETSTDMEWLAKQAIKNTQAAPKLFLACGTEDFLYEENCRYHQYLNEIGYEHVFSVKEGNHNWDFWDSEIQKVLRWLPITTVDKKLGF